MIKIDNSGRIKVEGVPVKELARHFPTPFYVYSEAAIRENIGRLRDGMKSRFKKFRIQYPVKANSNPHILAIMKDEGLSADISSPGELYIASKVGFPMERSTYTGNFESGSDLKAAFASGVQINLDDHHRLDTLLKYGRPKFISFRINPGFGRGGFEGIITGGTDAKFGIPYEQTREAYRKARKAGIRRFGIHMMTGSNILEPLHFSEVAQKLIGIAGEALAPLGIRLEWINIGGGFGIPYTDDETEIDIDHTFGLIANVFHSNVAKFKLGRPELVVEPGRYLVGNAGVLVSRVTHVKNSYKPFVGLDAGMNTLIRPSLYKAYHRILIDGKTSGRSRRSWVTGQICENSDIHPEEREFPRVVPGDVAVIRDVGAYGFAMCSQYNARPRPAEILVCGNQFKVIRRPESFEDMFRLVPDFDL